MEENNTPTPEHNQKQSKTVLVVILIVAALAVAGVAALIIANPSSAPTAQDQPTTATSGSSQSATITFTNDGFSPNKVTVKKGAKVTVVNKSSDPVQFSSGQHPTHREDPEINMGELAPGESGSFTVTVVGTHSFHDHLDASKTGTLVVTE